MSDTSSEAIKADLADASFFNLFGVFLTVVSVVFLMMVGAHTLKYIKTFACKIKIIIN